MNATSPASTMMFASDGRVMRARAREQLGSRSLVFELAQGQAARFDRDLFTRFVELAADAGATHIHVGLLPFRHDSWVLPDNDDPYAAWCNTSPGLLRVCPPEAIQPWVPVEQARLAQRAISQHMEIIRKASLKAVSFAVEPMWLPEGVYRAHPRWRGPQCELGRIARRPYFAPSIDEPEVLELYRAAMIEFCRLFPEIDQLSFLSNDSGAGIAWTPNVYPGMNGPTRHRTRDGGQRIADFLKTLQEAAREAGSSMRINLWSSGFPAELTASARHKLTRGLFVRGGNAHQETWEGGGASLAGGLWSTFYPVLGMGNAASFAAGLQNIYHNPENDSHRFTLGLGPAELERGRILIDAHLRQPERGLVARARTVIDAAAAFAGDPALAEPLAGAWEAIARAEQNVAQIRQKGFGLVLPFCCVSMRWLIRPLVPQPQNLTEEQIAYYRRFMFTTGTDEQNRSFSCVLGKSVFRGESVMWMARWCLQEAISTLQGARKTIADLAGKAQDSAAAQRLSLLAARTGAFACLCATVKNSIMYQYALDVAGQPQYGPNPMDYDDNIIYDQRALTLRKIAREELDNITELMELIRSQDQKVLEHADTPAEESVFMLGPDLLGDLQRKMGLMLDAWQEYEQLYPATKVDDFEPEPRGNIV